MMYLREFLAVLADEHDLVGEASVRFRADIVEDVRVARLGQSRVDRSENLRSHGERDTNVWSFDRLDKLRCNETPPSIVCAVCGR